MEFLNSENKKRTLLLITDAAHDMRELREMLSKHYTIMQVESKEDYSAVRAETEIISAAIISACAAAANDYALFEWIKTDSLIESVPMLLYCENDEDYALAGECLARGAIDVIEQPLREELILHRLTNSIRLKDSATFYEIERMLRVLPSNIFLKDEKGRYVFMTHYWRHLIRTDDPDWTVRGKTDLEVRKNKENARKAMSSDLEIFHTGKGTSYIIEENADGVREYLELIKEPVRDDDGKIIGIIALINDVTEKELMRMSLEEKALRDELTGVYNRRYFEKFSSRLHSGSNLPISFISADCNDLKSINDSYGHYVGDEYLRMTVMLFRTVLPEKTDIFRTDGDKFVIVLPNTSEDEAEKLVERMKAEAARLALKDSAVSIAFGVSSMRSFNENLRACIERADQRMLEDKRAYKEMKMLDERLGLNIPKL